MLKSLAAIRTLQRQKVRSWFEAFLNKYLGNRHVARAAIRYGCSNPAVVTELVESIATEKKEEVKKRKLQDEVHGAGEPVWGLPPSRTRVDQANKNMGTGAAEPGVTIVLAE